MPLKNKEITIEQLETAIDGLSTTLRQKIGEELDAFKKLTGVSICNVDVDLVSVRPIGEKRRTYVLNTVGLNVDFRGS